jgi:hypothetical protein
MCTLLKEGNIDIQERPLELTRESTVTVLINDLQKGRWTLNCAMPAPAFRDTPSGSGSNCQCQGGERDIGAGRTLSAA